MNLYTIGFTQKSAGQFFEALKSKGIKRVIDIRLNNKSQLAGFTKGNDLSYFLQAIAGISYLYKPEYAPTKEILDGYKKGQITWEEYEKKYIQILDKRNIMLKVNWEEFEDACLLCSESKPLQCHRRLLAEYLQSNKEGLTVIHL